MSDPADLANLRDIVVPPLPSYWPPAPGWWVVGFVLIAFVLIGGAHLCARYRANAYRRAALKELDALQERSPVEQAQAISTILKRVALVTYPRAEVASLSGTQWQEFLDRTGQTDTFTNGAASGLPQFALGGSSAGHLDAIRREAVRWIKVHRRGQA